MTPLPHADDPRQRSAGIPRSSQPSAGCHQGSRLPSKWVTTTAPLGAATEPPRRRPADISGSTSSCSPTWSKSTLALIVTHSRVDLPGPAMPQRAVLDGPTEAAHDGFKTGGAGFRSSASIGVVAGSNGERIEREVTRKLIERIASGVQGARLRSHVAARNAGATREEVAERFRRIAR
jgi:hypothetical protein